MLIDLSLCYTIHDTLVCVNSLLSIALYRLCNSRTLFGLCLKILVKFGLISRTIRSILSRSISKEHRVSIKVRKWIEFHDRLQIAFGCLYARLSAEISIYLFKPRVNSYRSETSLPLFIHDGFVSLYIISREQNL